MNKIGRETTGYLLSRVAKICRDYPAIIYKDKVFTYKDWEERSNQLANALLDMGVKKGDRVAMMGCNNNEYLEYEWGCMKIGLIQMFSSIAPAPIYPDEYAETLINKDDAKILFVHEAYLERLKKIRPKLKTVEKYIVIGERENVPSDMYHYETLISKYPKTEPQFDWDIQNDDIEGTAFSGGTTGIPKIIQSRGGWHGGYAIIIPRIIARNCLPKIFSAPESLLKSISKIFNSPFDEIFLDMLDLRFSEQSSLISLMQFLWDLPPYILVEVLPYIFRGKLSMVLNTPLWTSWGSIWAQSLHFWGGSVILPEEPYGPKESLDLVSKHKATMFGGIGPFDPGGLNVVNALKAEPERDLSSLLFTCIIAYPERKKQLLELHPHFMLDMITSSEVTTTAVNVLFRPDDEEMGSFYLNPDVRVINEKNEYIKPGESGRAIVSGKYCTTGYYKEPEKEKEAFIELDKKRWYITGEVGTLDEKGRFVIAGKEELAVKTGGKTVVLRDVDNIMARHPAIKIVGSVGVPDEKLGEAILTAIELKEGEKLTEEELIKFCKERMEAYKLPKRVVFLKENEMPVTRYGAVAYGPLKDLLKKKGYL